HARHPGVAVVLLQEPDDGAGAVPRARSLHPAHEAQEHAAPHAGRRAHHAPRGRILRLMREWNRTERRRRLMADFIMPPAMPGAAPFQMPAMPAYRAPSDEVHSQFPFGAENNQAPFNQTGNTMPAPGNDSRGAYAPTV